MGREYPVSTSNYFRLSYITQYLNKTLQLWIKYDKIMTLYIADNTMLFLYMII